jgi:hypothetical protein
MKLTYSLVVLFLFLLFVPLSGYAEEGDMLSKVSDEFCNALVAADAGKIKAAIATFEEMSSLSNRVKDQKEYRQMVDEWVKKMAREFKEARRRGPVVFGGVEIRDAMIFYPDNDKIKKLGVLAIVEPAFTFDGKPHKGFTPLFFIQVGHHWKVSIKK